jgi:mono/diheme cytochrome c family protein
MAASKSPQLNAQQILAVVTAVQNSLHDPEYGKTFIANPRAALQKLGLSDDDIQAVVDYTSTLAEGSSDVIAQCW